MIKVFCDRCGKEITSNATVVSEETEVTDGNGAVVFKLRGKTLHICEECQYNELTCGFKVGDKVITSDGCVGTITDICTCDQCRGRGFYEPEIQYNNGSTDYIMISDKNNGFKKFYKIGDRVFGNVDTEASKRIRERIIELKHEVIECEEQLNMIKKLEKCYERRRQTEVYETMGS